MEVNFGKARNAFPKYSIDSGKAFGLTDFG